MQFIIDDGKSEMKKGKLFFLRQLLITFTKYLKYSPIYLYYKYEACHD